MTEPRAEKPQDRCSFCGKSQVQVKRLIAGPGAVYICEQCVQLCMEIISEENAQGADSTGDAITLILSRALRELFTMSPPRLNPLPG